MQLFTARATNSYDAMLELAQSVALHHDRLLELEKIVKRHPEWAEIEPELHKVLQRSEEEIRLS